MHSETNGIVEQLIDKRELRGSFGSTQVIWTGEARDWELTKVLAHADPRQGTRAVRGPEQSHKVSVKARCPVGAVRSADNDIEKKGLAQVLAHPGLSEGSYPQFCTGR